MVLPTIVALSRDAIATVPHDQVEGALSVGATKWQTLRKVVVPGARVGITGAVTLAAARALGETIAVAMVIGGNVHLSRSLAQGGTTIAAQIAQSFDGATALTISNLFALSVILIAITASVNLLGRRLLHRANRGAML
jgi:phosphate transport system permease protein